MHIGLLLVRVQPLEGCGECGAGVRGGGVPLLAVAEEEGSVQR